MKNWRSVTLSHAFRTMEVRIGRRVFEIERLTPSTQRRLLALLNTVPADNRCVELNSDLTPVVYFYFCKQLPLPHLPGSDLGCFPAAHPRPVTEEQRARMYNDLCGKSRAEFTHQDYADWYTVTGWQMPRSTYTPKLRTVQQLWGVGTR